VALAGKVSESDQQYEGGSWIGGAVWHAGGDMAQLWRSWVLARTVVLEVGPLIHAAHNQMCAGFRVMKMIGFEGPQHWILAATLI